MGEHAAVLQTVSGRGYRIRFEEKTASTPVPASQPSRLAVLPLVNLFAEPEEDYFAAGLTEELIDTLAKLLRGRLSLIARTSAMRYKDTAQTAPEIASQLGVQYLLGGSVRRQNGRLRIAVRLLSAQTARPCGAKLLNEA